MLRLRIENEQILLQWYDVPDLVEWNCALNVGKDLSLDLNSREIPKYRTVPRRRRNQRRNTTSESSHQSSTHHSHSGRPRRATESDAGAFTDFEEDENLAVYGDTRPSSRNQQLADEYDYDSSTAHDNVSSNARLMEELELMGYHKPYKPISISRSVSKLKIWRRRSSSQSSPMGSSTSLDSLAVPQVGSSASLNNYNSAITARLAMTSLPNSPCPSPAPILSTTPPSPAQLSISARSRMSQKPTSAPIASPRRVVAPLQNNAESDDEYDDYDMEDEEDEEDDTIEVGEDEELIRQNEITENERIENEDDDDDDQLITVTPAPILKRALGAPMTATGTFTKWTPDTFPVNEAKHFKNCLRCIKPLLFDDSWLNKPILKPTSISTCSYTYIRWRHEAGIEDALLKDKNDKESRRKLISQMIIGDSSTLCKVPNHHLKEYIVGSHGLIPREVTFTL